MKGRVEVFSVEADGSETLIASENNLIVDGAGQTIVDMLTIPSSVSVISPEVLDASNWRIKAMTFGPAGGNFGNDPWYSDTSCTDGRRELLGAPAYYVTQEAIDDPTSWVNVDRTTDKAIRVLWTSSAFPAGSVTASSYTPPYKLPSYPDSLDTRLEKQDTAYVSVSADGAQSFGHFENRIQENPTDASSYLLGAFCLDLASDALPLYMVSSLEGDFVTTEDLHVVASGIATNTGNSFNGKNSVDYRGFVKIDTMDIATTGPGTIWVSGVGTQTTPEDFVNEGRIQITARINPQDSKMFLMYGGLHQLGLWTYDMQATLEKSITPPIAWTRAKEIQYRLFAKKTFTDNLVKVNDNGSSSGMSSSTPMYLRWTIDLRSNT